MGMSVTNILNYIYENVDSSIAFNVNCHRGVCRQCTLIVNGKKCLSCTELVTGDITIEPLKKEIVRDLVTI